jgi:predicted AAA+ superfamily ATPase
MKRIERKEYLDWLLRQKEKQIIKVVTGVRRCGKSTLFEIYRDYLLESGVDAAQIISLNFEDIEYEDLRDYKRLYEYVKKRLIPDKMKIKLIIVDAFESEGEPDIPEYFIKSGHIDFWQYSPEGCSKNISTDFG